MASLIKKNETVVTPAFKNGVSLQFFQLSFPSTVAAKLDTDTANYTDSSTVSSRSPVAVALDAVAQRASIEVIGNVQNLTYGTGQDLRFAVAALGGDFPTDTYDGTNSVTMTSRLQTLVRAASTGTSGWILYQGVNLALSTVTSVTI
jgi:hypothetical protein